MRISSKPANLLCLSLLILLWTGSCTLKTSAPPKTILAAASIESIILTSVEDSLIKYELSREQIQALTDTWNNAYSPRLLKAMPEFHLIIKDKNGDERRFRATEDWIKEGDDWAYTPQNSETWKIVSDVRHGVPLNLKGYTPLSFLEYWGKLHNKEQKLNVISIFPEIPENWITPEDLDELITMLDSTEKMGVLVNPFSSFMPEGYTEKGGIAAMFIQSYRDNQKTLFSSSAAFPKVDAKLNRELIHWWKAK